jgi:hypothetical protein
LVEIYNTGRHATFFAKDVGNYMFSEQLLTNFSTIFVIPMPDVVATERLVEIQNKHTKGQDFTMYFEICRT